MTPVLDSSDRSRSLRRVERRLNAACHIHPECRETRGHYPTARLEHDWDIIRSDFVLVIFLFLSSSPNAPALAIVAIPIKQLSLLVDLIEACRVLADRGRSRL
jgi:hypothetical protein